MDIRKIKKLIELLEESGIAEIEIKEGEEAVRISRMPVGVVTHAAAGCAPGARAAVTLRRGQPPPPVPARSHRSRRRNEHVITAPMVGTFYASPSPGGQGLRGDRR